MLKKSLVYFWSVRRQFAKYFVTGLTAVALDIGSLAFLKEVLRFSPLEAVIVSQIFLLAYVFLMNKYWSFGSRGLAHSQVVKFLVLSGFNYFFSVAWMWLWNEKFGFYYLGVRLINVALSVSWNFLLYKYWVYKMPQVSQKTDTGITTLD